MEQGSKEWLEFRKTRIGASDAPIIMGISPWCSPLKLWEQKLGLREATPTNEYMQRGHDLEEPARLIFEQLTGAVVFPQVGVCKDLPWMMASMDGLSIDGKTAVEIKTVSDKDHELAKQEIVPEKYYPQLQHQMKVWELDEIYYMSCLVKKRFTDAAWEIVDVHYFKVLRNEPYIKELVKTESEFYDRMVTLVPPEPTDQDFELREDDEWVTTTSAYLVEKQIVEEATLRMEGHKKKLVSIAGSSNIRGGGITLFKVVRRGAVDYAAIPDLKGVNLEQFRKKNIESWTIRKYEQVA